MGATHTRTLAEARDKAEQMRRAVADGTDPAGVIRVKPDSTAMTFKDCALALIEAKRPGWRNAKHAKQWETTLEQFTYPVIGDKLPADVSLADVGGQDRDSQPGASTHRGRAGLCNGSR